MKIHTSLTKGFIHTQEMWNGGDRKGKASEAAVRLTCIVVVDIGGIDTTEHRIQERMSSFHGEEKNSHYLAYKNGM